MRCPPSRPILLRRCVRRRAPKHGPRRRGRWWPLCAALVLPALLPASPRAGTVVDHQFYSPALGEVRDLRIYLPDGYDPVGTARYPVVYFLHGSNPNGYEPYWSMLTGILDWNIGIGAIKPLILVTPDGRCGPYRGSYFMNSELYGRFEDFTALDVVAYVDLTFRTIADRTGRCIMGHSMGGYGCMTLALKHPDRYCATAALSGPLELNLCIETRRDSVLAENTGPPYHYHPSAGFWTQATFTQAGAFWPDLQSPPYFVHFPLDSMGTILTDVLQRWRPHNPPYLASQYDPAAHLHIYFDCGMEDEKLEYPLNLAFRDSLDLLGLPYEFQAYHGGHNDQLPVRIPIALAFLDQAMGLASDVVVAPTSGWSLEGFDVLGPIPTRGRLGLRLTMKRPARVRATLHDVTGRSIVLLLDRDLGTGAHTFPRALSTDIAGRLPPGRYWVRLSAEAAVSVSRAVVLVR